MALRSSAIAAMKLDLPRYKQISLFIFAIVLYQVWTLSNWPWHILLKTKTSSYLRKTEKKYFGECLFTWMKLHNTIVTVIHFSAQIIIGMLLKVLTEEFTILLQSMHLHRYHHTDFRRYERYLVPQRSQKPLQYLFCEISSSIQSHNYHHSSFLYSPNTVLL